MNTTEEVNEVIAELIKAGILSEYLIPITGERQEVIMENN